MRVPTLSVQVARLGPDGEATDEVETREVRFTIALAQKFEAAFGGLPNLSVEAAKRPVAAAVKVLSVLLGCSEAEARQRLLPGTAAQLLSDSVRAFNECVGAPEPAPAPLGPEAEADAARQLKQLQELAEIS